MIATLEDVEVELQQKVFVLLGRIDKEVHDPEDKRLACLAYAAGDGQILTCIMRPINCTSVTPAKAAV